MKPRHVEVFDGSREISFDQILFAPISSPQNYGTATEFARPSKNGGVFLRRFKLFPERFDQRNSCSTLC
jgi:hypothetical protein